MAESAAIDAAAAALHEAGCSDPACHRAMHAMANTRADEEIARIVIEAVTDHIAVAERARLYAELGNEHYVTFTDTGWTVEHSVECRLSGRMSECGWHQAVKYAADVFEPDILGRWRITGISEGLPDLERAEREVPGA